MAGKLELLKLKKVAIGWICEKVETMSYLRCLSSEDNCIKKSLFSCCKLLVRSLHLLINSETR